MPHRIENDLCSENTISLMAIDFSVFPVLSFQFSKFHENEAKYDERKIEKGLTVTFKIKSL